MRGMNNESFIAGIQTRAGKLDKLFLVVPPLARDLESSIFVCRWVVCGLIAMAAT